MNVQTKNTNTNKNTQTQIQKHKQVEPNGEYVKPPQEKMSYATMVFVRTAIGEAIVHSWCSVCFYDYWWLSENSPLINLSSSICFKGWI